MLGRDMEQPRTSAKIGFRRWYERQLFASFGWLVVLILIGFSIGVALEFMVISQEGMLKYATLVVLYVFGLLGITTWRRFWGTLSSAQRRASGATCSECGSYGLFDVPEESDEMWARCRKCGHQWTIG